METVCIRELRKSDSRKYFEWINDRDLVLFFAPFTPVSEAFHSNWFDSVTEDNHRRLFSIVIKSDNDTDILIGYCTLRNIDFICRSAQLQIRIGEKKQQNKGFGTIATKQLLEFGFKDLNLNRIYLDVFENNERARRLYARCGFIEEGVKRESAFIDGEYINLIQMSVLAKEYAF